MASYEISTDANGDLVLTPVSGSSAAGGSIPSFAATPIPAAGSATTGNAIPQPNISGGAQTQSPSTQSGQSYQASGSGILGSDPVSTLANMAQTIFADITNQNQQAFNNQMSTKMYNLSAQAQEFQQGIQEQQLGLQRTTTSSNIATQGQQNQQSAVSFNQSQIDRQRQEASMNALSTGIAQGLARPSRQGQLLGQQANPAPQTAPAQPSPYIGTATTTAPSNPTQLSSPTLSGTPKA
jgi:hypothetical protein